MKYYKPKMIAVIAALFVLFISSGIVRAEGTQMQVAAGIEHRAAIDESGSLWTWGRNISGELGNGSTIDRRYPVKALDQVAQVSLGFSHSAALKQDGSLWMWGSNEYGQIGSACAVGQCCSTPQKVLDQVKQVCLSYDQSAAVTTDGRLLVWGCNDSCLFASNQPTPTKILDGVASVSLGCYHGAALKTDGSLWMWGKNDEGQIGNGNTTDQPSPVKIMDGVSQVSLGWKTSMALKKDGTLWTWGYGYYGQLGKGDANTNSCNSPVQIMDQVAQADMGQYNGAAVKMDGSLYIWGRNDLGQLGTGNIDTAHMSPPVKLTDNVWKVELGINGGVILKQDKTIYSWGESDNYIPEKKELQTYWLVTFVDGTEKLCTEEILNGGSATAPQPSKTGYTLTWDTPFDHVTKDLTVTAVWSKIPQESATEAGADNGSDKEQTSDEHKGTGSKQKALITSIKITAISSKIAAGKKVALKAAISPANAGNKSISWLSSNKRYATVNSKGIVTTKASGIGKTVTITAKANDGSKKKAVYQIRIMKGVVKKVTLRGKKTLKAGKTLKLKAKVTATSGANKALIYTSSNERFATVTKSGKVKALKAGKGKTVKITAAATDGSGKKAVLRIRIK